MLLNCLLNIYFCIYTQTWKILNLFFFKWSCGSRHWGVGMLPMCQSGERNPWVIGCVFPCPGVPGSCFWDANRSLRGSKTKSKIGFNGGCDSQTPGHPEAAENHKESRMGLPSFCVPLLGTARSWEQVLRAWMEVGDPI